MTCSSCGASVQPDHPAGLCASCLLRLGLEPAVDRSASSRGGSSDRVLPPMRLGSYELIEEIGRGGMGVVYRARQPGLSRVVALKYLHGAEWAAPRAIARFELEARTAAQLDHPNIVPIFEVGEIEGQPYYTMRLVEGVSLHRHLVAGHFRFPARAASADRAAALQVQNRIARLLAAIARAVHHAHLRGILHRDLTAGNILLDGRDEPFLTDFGIAKLVQQETGLTRTVDLLGTPGYLAPELVLAQPASVGTDVYSLGIVLYELLTGQVPFAGRTTIDTLRQIVDREPLPISTVQPTVHPDLQTVCLKCLDKRADRRYASAADLADDLDRFLRQEPVSARPATRTERVRRWCRRQPALAASFATLGIVVLAGLVLVTGQWRRAERHARDATLQTLRAEQAVRRLRLEWAEGLLAQNETSLGLAHLAVALDVNPADQAAAERLLSALIYRDFSLPVFELHSAELAVFGPDSECFATADSSGELGLRAIPSGRPLGRHPLPGEAVTTLAFSADGRWLLAGTREGRVWMWARDLKQPPIVVGELGAAVRSLAWDAAVGRLAAGAANGQVAVWKLPALRPLPSPLAQPAAVSTLQFSADGRRLLVVREGGWAELWDADSGLPALDPIRHGSAILRAEFSPDGLRVLTASDDHTARVWRIADGLEIGPPIVHDNRITAARFSPDGRRILTASWDVTARLWETETLRPVGAPIRHAHWIWTADFSPEALRVVTASEDGFARIWSAVDGRPLSQPLAHTERVLDARFSPDGQWLLTREAGGLIRLWDTRPGQALPLSLPHAQWVRTACFSPDGSHVLTASADGTAILWDSRSGRQVAGPFVHEDALSSAQFSPDGLRVATASWDGTARVWESDSGRPITPFLRHQAAVRSACFSPDGTRLVTASDDGTARVWDLASGEPIAAPMRHAAGVLSARFDSSGQRVVTASKDGTAALWCAANCERLGQPLEHGGPVNYAEFSPDGRQVVTASSDRTARLWHVDTGATLTASWQHQGEVHRARFSPDSARVVTASHDGTARVWDTANGRLAATLTGHRHWVWSAVFSLDGTRIVTASEDGTARVWSAFSGLPLSEPLPHDRFLRTAEFSPDGERVVTAAAEGVARVWEVPKAGLIAPAWLPQLAVVLGGRRWVEGDTLEPVPPGELHRIRQKSAAHPSGAGVDGRLDWLLADRETRPVAPATEFSRALWRQERLREGTQTALSDILLQNPRDGVATARLAMLSGSLPNRQPDSCYPDPVWLLARARQLAPGAAELRQAEALLARVVASTPAGEKDPTLRDATAATLALGSALISSNRLDEALAALEPYVRLPNRAGQSHEVLMLRTECLRRLGRFADAAEELERALGIQPRPPEAGPDSVDLSAFYNAGLAGNWHGDQLDNDLAQLPTGIRPLNGVPFDVRGLIQLRRVGGQGTPAFPAAVSGIPVNRVCRQIHALHGAIHGEAPPGTAVGAYVLHYADGEQHTLPLVLGRHVADWWAGAGSPGALPEAVVGWQGSNGKSRAQGMGIRLFHSTWPNPRPEVPLSAIDFVSALSPTAPFLVAITLE